jgi:NAD+ kinase
MAVMDRVEVENKTKRVLLFGAEADCLQAELGRHGNLEVVTEAPDVILCYGGDGTLLHAEFEWPTIPKVPILNSDRGHRCITHPSAEVIEGLAADRLLSTRYTKLSCCLKQRGREERRISALNEINVHMGRINSAVRFRLSLNGHPYEDGLEILGDGFLICTPFGSTAYYSAITRAAFYEGIGIAFKSTNEHTNHLVVPESYTIAVKVSRGPAVLAYDSAQDYVELREGDSLEITKHPQGATILTCAPVQRPDEPF